MATRARLACEQPSSASVSYGSVCEETRDDTNLPLRALDRRTDHRLEFGGRKRLPQNIAFVRPKAIFTQKAALIVFLDAFGNDAEQELIREADRESDRRVVVMGQRDFDERPIDFQFVER